MARSVEERYNQIVNNLNQKFAQEQSTYERYNRIAERVNANLNSNPVQQRVNGAKKVINTFQNFKQQLPQIKQQQEERKKKEQQKQQEMKQLNQKLNSLTEEEKDAISKQVQKQNTQLYSASQYGADYLSQTGNISKADAQKLLQEKNVKDIDDVLDVEKELYIKQHQEPTTLNLPDGKTVQTDKVEALPLGPGFTFYTNIPDRFNVDNSTSGKLWRNVQAIAGNTYKSAESGVANFADYTINLDKKARDIYNSGNTMQKIAMATLNPGLISESVLPDEIKEKDLRQIEELQDTLKFTKSSNAELMQRNVEDATNPVTKKVAELAESGGNNLLGAGLSAINPVLGTAYFVGSAGGSYYDEAIERGMNEDQALLYGTIMGGMEGITEEILAGKNIKAFKRVLAGTGLKNEIARFGIDIGENFLQEAVMPGISELTAYGVAGKKAMNYNLKVPTSLEDWKKILTGDFTGYNEWGNLLQQSITEGVDGALSAILMGGVTRGVSSAIKLTTEMSKGNKPSTNDIAQVVRDCEKAGIDTKAITQQEVLKSVQKHVNEQQTTFYGNKDKYSIDLKENSLQNKNYTFDELDDSFYKTLNGVETSDGKIIQGYFDDNNNLVMAKITEDQFGYTTDQEIKITPKDGKYSGKEINNAIKELSKVENENKPLDGQIDIENNVQNPIKNQNNNSQQQISQTENKNGLNRNVEGQNLDNFIKSAQENNLDINNKSLRQIGELSLKRNVQTLFDASKFQNSNANAMYVTDENGNRFIYLNPNNKNTSKTLQQIELHEMVHDMYKSEGFEKVKEMILNYDKGKAGYAEARQALEDLYSQVYDRNADNFSALVDEEAVADILGNKLGDQQFINTLVNQSDTRNWARRFYDWVVEKLNNMTRSLDSVNEYFFWKDVKNKFENAFREEHNGTSNSTRFLVEYNGDGTFKKVKIEDDIFKNSENKSISRTIKDYLSKHIGEYAEIIESGQKVYLGEDLPGEYSHSKSTQNLSQQDRLAKGRATTGLKEIIENAQNRRWQPNIKEKHEVDAKYGFYRYNTVFSFEHNGREYTYSATVLIRNDANGKKYLYDILEPKKIGSNLLPVASNSTKSSAIIGSSNFLPNNSVSQNKENVKLPKPTKKFSKSEDTSNKTLLALHNLNEDKLKGILELGGFPVPSIAITNPDIVDHGQFGDISVVFDKDTIDPANSQNEVYDRDVWSPVVPEINYDINNSNIKEYITNNLNYDSNDPIIKDAILSYMYESNLSDLVNRRGISGALKTLKESNPLKYFYKTAVEKGEYNPIMKQANYSNSNNYTNEELQKFLDKYKGEKPLNELNYEETLALGDTISDIIKEKFYKEAEKLPTAEMQDSYKKLGDEVVDSIKDNYNKLNNFIYSANSMQQNGINNQVIDEGATLENISKNVNQENYEKWVDSTFGKLFNEVKRGIRNSKDLFTPSGNRRGFNQLYDEYNLYNLVKIMTKGKTKAGQKTFFEGGFGKTSAELAHQFKSIQDIKNNESKIKNATEIKPLVEELTDKFNNDAHELLPYAKKSGLYKDEIATTMEAFENIHSAIQEFAGKNTLNVNAFKDTLEDYSMFNVDEIPNGVLESIIEDLDQIKNIPTDYFEAKPQRAVGLDEVKAIVVPNNMNQELKQQLIDRGLNVVEYDANKEGDRQAKIKALDEYKFSKTTDGKWQNRLDTLYKNKNKGTYLQDVKLPTKENVQKYSVEENKGNLPTKETINQKNTQEQSGINLPPKVSANNQYKDTTTKVRKHYKSIIESANTTSEAKAIAKELMGTDTYIPETNKGELERADEKIMNSTPESELNSLMSRATVGEKITPVDIAVGERLIQYYSKMGDGAKLQDAIQATAMAGTTAGQTVQAMSLLNHMTPEGQAVWLQRSVDKMNNKLKKTRGKNAQQFTLTDEMLQKIVGSENQEQLTENLNEVYKELGQQVNKSTMEKIDAWRYFSMLANPRTHIRNIGGNVAMGKVQTGKNKVAGVIEATVAKFNPGMERTHTIVPASKDVKQFAKADIKNVTDRLGLTEGKLNPQTRLENNMKTFKHETMNKTIGKLFDLNNKALEVEDGWGLKAGYAKALAEYMTANKLKPNTITDAQLSKARNYAIQQAKEATFHQENQLASLVNQLSNRNKFAKFGVDAVLPFKKTPMNIAKTGIEYSPVGLAKSMVLDTAKLRKGNITVNQYIDNISKGLTGTGIALVGYALAQAGILKASGGDDDKEKYEEGRGKQAFSIQIGDNTYSLDWLAPTAIPLFIGAEISALNKATNEAKTSNSSDEDSKYNQLLKTTTNVLDAFTNSMNPMMEMSMLSGLASTLRSYEQGATQGITAMGTNAVKSYVNQFVPTALGQVAKTTDEYERSTTSTKTGMLPKAVDSTKNQIMAKVPGLRQMLPTKTDVWGNDMKQPSNVVQRSLENAVLPYTRKELNNNEVDQELVRLYEERGEKSVLPSSSLSKDLTFSGEKYKMTSEEFAKYKKDYGSKSYSLINELVNSSDYNKLSDEDKQQAIENVYKYAKEYAKDQYAKANDIEYTPDATFKTAQAMEKSGNVSSYFNYLAKTDGMKEKEKMKVLVNASYGNNDKKLIYENTIGSDDSLYNTAMQYTGININEYLKYKTQEFTSDKTDDGTVDGKTVSGSKKSKVYDYVNNKMKINYEQRLLLLGTQYKLADSERATLSNYIENLKITKNQKLEIYKKLQGFTVYKDGRVTY